MKHVLLSNILAITLLASGAALAQYTGPSSDAAAPAVAPLTTAAQLQQSGRDDHYARLQGRIVSHEGGKQYTFADDSGRLAVEISAKRFPAGRPIGADQWVELLVQVDVDPTHKEFEVEQITLLP
jgi:uncharacterized protein (TIGR00156 family)